MSTQATKTGTAPRKPKDNRLRESFQITSIEGVGERVICLHCSDYDRTLSKFNATKARSHLIDQCTGVTEEMREMFRQSTQAAKKLKNEMSMGAEGSSSAMMTTTTNKKRKVMMCHNRPSLVYLAFYLEHESIIVTAPIEKGDLIFHLAFPRNELNLKFNAENAEGAAVVIDGFMNKMEGHWSCSMRKVGAAENLGTAGDYCQWNLGNTGSMSRFEKVKEILKSLVMM